MAPMRHTLATLALMTLFGFLAACAGGVRGEPPFAQVMGWRVAGETLGVDLRLRNVNDEAMEVQGLDVTVALGDDTPLFRHTERKAVEIAPGGFETLRLEVRAEAAGLAAFERLSAGDTGSLVYELSGTVSTAESGSLPIGRTGRIYTVPGRPGEFR